MGEDGRGQDLVAGEDLGPVFGITTRVYCRARALVLDHEKSNATSRHSEVKTRENSTCVAIPRRLSTRGRWLLASALLLSSVGDLEALQADTSLVLSEASPLRSIQLDLATRVVDSGPGAGPLGRVVVAPDSSLFAIIEIYHLAEVNVYDRTGTHVRTIGRSGRGPGEFRIIMTIAALGDTLFAFDNAQRRETALTFDGTYLRDRRIPAEVSRALPFPDGRVVLSAVDPTPSRIGAPLHIFDAEGSAVLSFPNAGVLYRADEQHLLERALTRASDSSFWSAPPNEYVLRRWNLSGKKERTLVRRAPWFESHGQVTLYHANIEPLPELRDVYYDVNGLLWVLIHVSDDRWNAQFRDDPGLPADMRFTFNYHDYWDSLVEVIDTRRGVVLASERFDGYFSGFTNVGQLSESGKQPNGKPYIAVWNLTMRPGPSPGMG